MFGAGIYSWQKSISHYFYSTMHIAFVSILCVLGGFLITYRGKDKWESRVSNLAGFFAICIAAFPTGSVGYLQDKDHKSQYLQLTKAVTEFWGGMHFAFAIALFACFIIFCLYFFQKPDAQYHGDELKKFKKRKLIYTICGWVIIFSIAMIPLFIFVIKSKEGIFVYSTFIFEAIALWAFGTAWLVKGSAALKSIPVVKNMIQRLR